MLTGKRVLITGGTGSLGKVLVRRLLSGEMGKPERITVFSRDEAKQHSMRLQYQEHKAVTDEVIYNYFKNILAFRIGDVAKDGPRRSRMGEVGSRWAADTFSPARMLDDTIKLFDFDQALHG